MSDGYDGGDYGHINHDAEQYDLDHGHAEQAYDQNHDANYNAYGQEHNYENDLHYNHGEAEHYHAPDGTDYSKVEYTNLDAHVEDHEAAYAENYDQHDSEHAYNEADYLKEHFAHEFLDADYGHNYLDSGDGHAAIAAK